MELTKQRSTMKSLLYRSWLLLLLLATTGLFLIAMHQSQSPSNFEWGSYQPTSLEKADWNEVIDSSEPPAVDFVYTWVNGSDPEFIKSLNDQLMKESKKPNGEAITPARFFDWNTMKYSLRSIEKYAPWLRNLYLITNGQVPEWLNVSSPNVHLVTHDDIFSNKSNLPTFNSDAIESAMASNADNLTGISDKFLFFNDDFFIGAPVSRDHFFYQKLGQWVYTDFAVKTCYPGCHIDKTGNGLCNLRCNNTMCNYDGHDCLPAAGNNSMKFEVSNNDTSAWTSSLAVSNGILSQRYGIAKRPYISHAPYFLDKRILRGYSKAFAAEVEKAMSSRFRTSDINLPFMYFNYVMGQMDKYPEEVILDELANSGHFFDQLEGVFSSDLSSLARDCQGQASHNKTACENLKSLIKHLKLKFTPSNKYNYGKRSGYGGKYVEWVAINTNAGYVRKNLERWDKNKRPFAFLQDGVNGKSPNRTAAFEVLQKHLQKKFPLPSKFEKIIPY